MAVTDEFGDYGSVLTHDLILGDIGGMTAEQAIKAGVNTREIWLALCRANDVPAERWHGVGIRAPRNT